MKQAVLITVGILCLGFFAPRLVRGLVLLHQERSERLDPDARLESDARLGPELRLESDARLGPELHLESGARGNPELHLGSGARGNPEAPLDLRIARVVIYDAFGASLGSYALSRAGYVLDALPPGTYLLDLRGPRGEVLPTLRLHRGAPPPPA